MDLDIQIYSFLVSFLFGIVFYYLLDFFNKVICKLKICFKIIFSFLFIIIMSLFYFIIMLYVNNGVIHIYFLLSILVGYIFVYKFLKGLFTHSKRKY